MKKTVTGCFAAIALTLLCSCVSTPAPKSDAAPESAPEATPSEVNAASPENPAENSEPVGEVAPAQEKPAETENPPGVPAEEKFLQYYPEPETLVIVPETPAKPVTEKVARTEEKKSPQKPEKKPEAPKAEEKKPAALPEEAKTEEKATAEIFPGIWENEPVAPSVMPVESKPAVAPSRKATLAVGQTLEVWYPATGWVYLGDASAQNGLGYQTRKMDKNDTLFTFKAVKEGNYILDFSRYDVLTDGFTADSIAVSVNATGTGKQDKVRAPDYRGANADETQGKEEPVAVTPGAVSGDEPSLQVVQPVGVGESADQASINPDELLQKARASLSNGDAAAALTQLDSFFGLAVSALDEGWFLRGQAYEANTPSRDMKKALEAYETLTAAYPDSARWKDADARIRYIRQFYLRIR